MKMVGTPMKKVGEPIKMVGTPMKMVSEPRYAEALLFDSNLFSKFFDKKPHPDRCQI